jgi:hypothetical protein
MTPRLPAVVVSGLLVLVAAGCGSSTSNRPARAAATSSSATSTAGSPTSTPKTSSTSSAPRSAGAGALSAEAQAAATGDIPDTQVFLAFHDAQAGYSMKYPEGWTQRGAGANVTLSDKNNIVHILIRPGGPPSPASVRAELIRLRSSNRSLTFNTPTATKLPVGAAVKATYTTESAPNPVTGKRVTLIVDRYEFGHGHDLVTVDLGTPRGVDNVDAYRLMVTSFAWR